MGLNYCTKKKHRSVQNKFFVLYDVLHVSICPKMSKRRHGARDGSAAGGGSGGALVLNESNKRQRIATHILGSARCGVWIRHAKALLSNSAAHWAAMAAASPDHAKAVLSIRNWIKDALTAGQSKAICISGAGGIDKHGLLQTVVGLVEEEKTAISLHTFDCLLSLARGRTSLLKEIATAIHLPIKGLRGHFSIARRKNKTKTIIPKVFVLSHAQALDHTASKRLPLFQILDWIDAARGISPLHPLIVILVNDEPTVKWDARTASRIHHFVKLPELSTLHISAVLEHLCPSVEGKTVIDSAALTKIAQWCARFQSNLIPHALNYLIHALRHKQEHMLEVEEKYLRGDRWKHRKDVHQLLYYLSPLSLADIQHAGVPIPSHLTAVRQLLGYPSSVPIAYLTLFQQLSSLWRNAFHILPVLPNDTSAAWAWTTVHPRLSSLSLSDGEWYDICSELSKICVIQWIVDTGPTRVPIIAIPAAIASNADEFLLLCSSSSSS